MSLDRYHFAVTFDPSAQSVPDKTAFFSDTSLTILADNVHPATRRRRLRDQDVFLFGNPIANGRRDDDEVLEALGQSDRPSGNIAKLNGSFLLLIYDRQQKELTVTNDRFASLSLQSRRDGRAWQAASSLKWLWDRGAEPGWRGRVADAIAAPELEAALPFFDWPLVRERAKGWMAQLIGGASFLVELLSLQLFLKDTRQP